MSIPTEQNEETMSGIFNHLLLSFQSKIYVNPSMQLDKLTGYFRCHDAPNKYIKLVTKDVTLPYGITQTDRHKSLLSYVEQWQLKL